MDLAVHRVQNELPCPVCGQKTNYSWGEFQGNGYGGYSMPKAVSDFGGKREFIEIAARRCNECGNVQHFDGKFVADPSRSVFQPNSDRSTDVPPDAKSKYTVIYKTSRPSITKTRVKRDLSPATPPAEVKSELESTEGEQRWQEYLDGRE